jgi:hypothetical protein
MTPQNIELALAILQKHNVSREQGMEVLALVAEKLQEEKTLAKAKRTGLTVEQVRGMDLGRSAAADLNDRLGYSKRRS